MVRKIIKYLPNNVLSYLSSVKVSIAANKLVKADRNRNFKYGITEKQNKWSYENMEAQITKVYHSIEKGLAYKNIRLGFGKNNIEILLNLLKIYDEKGFDKGNKCYQGAINTLQRYIEIHENSEINIEYLKNSVSKLAFESKENIGGTYHYSKKDIVAKSKGDFKEFSSSRHSVRDFSEDPVDLNTIYHAIELAQHTPSACNRQPWGIKIISDENTKKIIRNNQNGNKGFGEKFDKILIVTGDIEYFYVGRETNQVYIDGGMYAMNILYALHYYNIAAVPLSASLSITQEKNIRQGVSIKDSEVMVMFIGIGNYVEEYKVPKSYRRNPKISII